MTDNDLVDRILDEYYLHGDRDNIAAFMNRAPSTYKSDLCCRLVEQDISRRMHAGEHAWIDDYVENDEIAKRLWPFRADLTRMINRMIHSSYASLTKHVGLDTLNEYYLSDMLGFGGFACTFLAKSPRFPDEQVVVKVCHRYSPDAAMRLEDEAEVLKSLQTGPPIRGLPEFVGCNIRHPVWPYLAYKYVEGTTLSTWLLSKHDDVSRLELCEKLSILVRELHTSGSSIAHCDLSTENFLVSEQNEVCDVALIDFGSARRRFIGRGWEPAAALRYAAPEIHMEELGLPSRQSDVWSLGVILHECLSKTHPFDPLGEEIDSDLWIKRLREGPDAIPPAFGDSLNNLIGRCLAFHPAKRTAYVQDLVTAIQHARALPEIGRALAADRLLVEYLQRIVKRFGSLKLSFDDFGSLEVPLDSLFIDLPLRLVEGVSPDVHEISSAHTTSHREQLTHARRSPAKPPTHRLGEWLSQNQSIVIVGHSGCGKSTLLAGYIVQSAQAELRRQGMDTREFKPLATHQPSSTIPLVLICQQCGGGDLTSFESLVTAQMLSLGFGETDRRILVDRMMTLIAEGKATLFVDGLNEISAHSDRQRKFCRLISECQAVSPIIMCLTPQPSAIDAFRSMLPGIVQVVLDELQTENVLRYVSNWVDSRNLGDQKRVHRLLIQNISINRLCKNFHLLTLLTQFATNNMTLPQRRLDLFDRIVREIVKAQKGVHKDQLTLNEIRPHLEHLAANMQCSTEVLQSLPDRHICRIFKGLREQYPDEPDLNRRSPERLLDMIIDTTGLLIVNGEQRDHEGFERRSIAFRHESFRAFFAAQAITYGRTSPRSVEELLTSLLSDLRAIDLPHAAASTPDYEEILERWLETVSLAIASLTERTQVDKILEMVIHCAKAEPLMSRALAIIALTVLGDEPNVSDQCAIMVFQHVISVLTDEDGIGSAIRTPIDIAITNVRASRFGESIQRQLFEAAAKASGDDRIRIMQNALPRLGNLSDAEFERQLHLHIANMDSAMWFSRVNATMSIVGLIFHNFGWQYPEYRMPFMARKWRGMFINDLTLRAVHCIDPLERLALIWVIYWLIVGPDIDVNLAPRINEELHSLLVDLFRSTDSDDPALGRIAMVLTSNKVVLSPCEPQSVLDELALIADGAMPQKDLRKPWECEPTGLEELLVARLKDTGCFHSKLGISRALGRIGIYVRDMEMPLIRVIRDEILDPTNCDEAFVSLTQIKSATVREFFLVSSCMSRFDQQYLASRGMFGLLAQGEPDTLKYALLTHPQFKQEYAFGLAGIEDNRGRQILLQLQNHENEEIRVSVAEALSKAVEWGLHRDTDEASLDPIVILVTPPELEE